MHEMKLINYRTAKHVVTAEFLLDLYAQRNPRLNPFIFDDVVVEMRGDEVRSFAASPGWLRLRTLLAQRLMSDLDSVRPVLHDVLRSPRPLSRKLLTSIGSIDPADLSDAALVVALMDLHYTALSEIYEVNLVQLEQGLQEALTSRARELGLELADARRAVLGAMNGATETHLAAFETALRGRVAESGAVDARTAIDAAYSDFHAFAGGYGAAVSREAFASAAGAILREERPQAAARADHDNGNAGPLLEDPLFQELSGLAVELGERRDSNKALLGQVNREKERILEEIRVRLDMPLRAFRWMRLEEIQLALHSRIFPTDEDLSTREQAGMRFERRQSHTTPGAASIRLEGDKQATDFFGVPASRGTYTGRVCVVRSGADIDRMAMGDVLVAAGTDFDMLLLVRLAGAIVTEEGGMLSHAAVVARELGIPAVIGIDNAPLAFSDGDIVTVDADSGMVRRDLKPTQHNEPRASEEVKNAAPVIELHPLAAATEGDFGGKARGLAQLHRLGLRMPDPVYLLAHDALDDPAACAAAIANAFPNRRVSLRSSANVEDQADGSAAGIFTSSVGVETSKFESLVSGLVRVRASGPTGAASSYLTRRGRGDAEVRVHIAAHPFLEFDYRGTALSTWGSSGAVIAEIGTDTAAQAGLEPKPFKRVQIHAHPDSRADTRGPGYAGVFRELRREMKRIENIYGTPVECEFGVRDNELYFLQVRKVVSP